jgi:exopolysaccharide biosynthesis polyprenyl glycosylphosphotransferase
MRSPIPGAAKVETEPQLRVLLSSNDTVDMETSYTQRALPAPARDARGLPLRRALLSADIVGLLLAYLATRLDGADRTFDHRGIVLVFLLTLPLWTTAAKLYGLYDSDERHPDHSTVDELGRVFQFVTVGSWLMLAALWLFTSSTPRESALIFWLVAVVAVPAARSAARTASRHYTNQPQNTIIVGAGVVGQLIGRKLLQHPEFGIRLVGFVDSEPKTMRGDLVALPVLGSQDDIVDIVRRHEVRRVVIAFTNDRHDVLVELVRSLCDLDVQIDLVPRLFEAVGPTVGVHMIEGIPLVSLPPSRPSPVARKAKRAIDLVAAASALILLAPLMAVVAWRVKRDSPGPVIFRQERLGEGRQPFILLKFRTMLETTDERPHREYVRAIMDPSAPPPEGSLYKLKRENQVTRAGAWLRRTSLDELPQLINVLRGEMSMVGPRPCLPYETELFEPHHFDRFLVPAGMTGLWQVSARAHATFKEALDLDTAYARSWSLRLDLWLLARTPATLLRGGETA